jgi:hypothetical protein
MADRRCQGAPQLWQTGRTRSAAASSDCRRAISAAICAPPMGPPYQFRPAARASQWAAARPRHLAALTPSPLPGGGAVASAAANRSRKSLACALARCQRPSIAALIRTAATASAAETRALASALAAVAAAGIVVGRGWLGSAACLDSCAVSRVSEAVRPGETFSCAPVNFIL